MRAPPAPPPSPPTPTLLPPLAAGPVNIHDKVLRAMSVPGQNHRDPWFAEVFKKVLADSKLIYGTKEGTPFIFPGASGARWLQPPPPPGLPLDAWL